MGTELPIATEQDSTCSCCATTNADPAGAQAVIDPVCGMSVDPATARATVTHEGTTYYFCAPGCGRAFGADPQQYLAAAGSN